MRRRIALLYVMFSLMSYRKSVVSPTTATVPPKTPVKYAACPKPSDIVPPPVSVEEFVIS